MKLSNTECPSRYLMQNSNRSKQQFSSIQTKKRLGFIIAGFSKGPSQRLSSCIELRTINIQWFLMREFATRVIWWSLTLILLLWQQTNCQIFGFFILMEWASWFLRKKMNWLKHKLSKNTLSQEKPWAWTKWDKFIRQKNSSFVKFYKRKLTAGLLTSSCFKS